MHTRINLVLLRNQFDQLSQTHYFDRPTQVHVSKLLEVANYVIDNLSTLDSEIVKGFVDRLWISYQYMSGSASREFPYEIVFALRRAFKDWIKTEAVITTALLEDCNFHFRMIDPWDFIKATLPEVEALSFDAEFVHIAMPRLYKSKPLYCSPLYHELGHFIDIKFGISSTLALLTRELKSVDTNVSHLREYFADLFSASYCGYAANAALQCLADGHAESVTHPSTQVRMRIIQDFLEGKTNRVIENFQISLNFLQLPALECRFSEPNLIDAFNNIQPYRIPDDRELHGIFVAGWQFLTDRQDFENSLTSFFGEEEFERMVNDLVEKSIRNYAIAEQWHR